MVTIGMTTLAGLAALVLLSYAVEALRSRPTPPVQLYWDPGIAIKYADLGGIRVRYVTAGTGPNLVLLHTLRTQLDIFQWVIPDLSKQFTVYAWDYPGHGWSDIPTAEYAPEDFYRWTADFLERLGITQVSLAGISIGGTIALVLAARRNPRIARVLSINPYDYPPVGGIRKSSFTARLILGPSAVPILGATLMRLRNRFVSDRIMEGGVASPGALKAALRKELYDVGARQGHYQGFLSLLAHEQNWSEARTEYPHIRVPTLLIYGEQAWAPLAMREQSRALIPGAAPVTLRGGSHFLSLDQPRELSELITRFATSAPPSGGARS
jgi:pimeloyl-ACP methyl ester carboxylesterase